MKSSLKKSLALHLIVLLLCVIDMPMFWFQRSAPSSAPIIVDLKNVKISALTNLPPKAKIGKEDKQASKIKRKIEKKYSKSQPSKKPETKPSKTKSKAKEEVASKPKKDFLVAPKSSKKPLKSKTAPKPDNKPKPSKSQKTPKPENSKTPELANPLKSLLASVDALEKEGEKSQTATIKEGTKVNNMGVEGGTEGSYFSELSISEMDALAGQLRACWNLDPGAMGIEDMIVEIKAVLTQSGLVSSVDIVDKSRYNTDPHFRSVADSAKRAVYICAPYKILSERYAEKYEEWKVLKLRFNPIDQSVR